MCVCMCVCGVYNTHLSEVHHVVPRLEAAALVVGAQRAERAVYGGCLGQRAPVQHRHALHHVAVVQVPGIPHAVGLRRQSQYPAGQRLGESKLTFAGNHQED